MGPKGAFVSVFLPRDSETRVSLEAGTTVKAQAHYGLSL
jgi:hypothetical protein